MLSRWSTYQVLKSMISSVSKKRVLIAAFLHRDQQRRISLSCADTDSSVSIPLLLFLFLFLFLFFLQNITALILFHRLYTEHYSKALLAKSYMIHLLSPTLSTRCNIHLPSAVIVTMMESVLDTVLTFTCSFYPFTEKAQNPDTLNPLFPLTQNTPNSFPSILPFNSTHN